MAYSIAMYASHRIRRILPALVALPLALGAATLGPASADAKPTIGPNVSPTMFTGKHGTGCRYEVTVVVSDPVAPVQLLMVDHRGRVLDRLVTRNERRTDAKRVVEGYWVPRHTGMIHAVAVQNGIRKVGKPFPVTPGYHNGSLCFGL
ncbi:hypothetical protein [Gordonia crocea]|nr:hypothetical protein [Gordonia crocea]